MSPYQFLAPFRRFFRTRRFKGFKERFAKCRTIVDIGGDHTIWTIIGRKSGVTVLNLWAPEDRDGIPYVLGNGLQLPFGDQTIDLAFSNSAIEHVGNFENQVRFAKEMLRVGKQLYCQTPCRLFPVDPHLGAFFLHWLPQSFLMPFVLRYLTINGLLLGRPYEYDVTWLSKSKLREIFPGCTIKVERIMGLPKSFIITR
jgi:hypothetical protein